MEEIVKICVLAKVCNSIHLFFLALGCHPVISLVAGFLGVCGTLVITEEQKQGFQWQGGTVLYLI